MRRGILNLTTNGGSIFPARFIGVVALFVATAASAGTFTVGNTADSGPGSLRQAMVLADESNELRSNIVFDQAVKGATITLKTSLPTINKELTITGPDRTSSAGITISGNNAVQILRVGPAGTLNLGYLTLSMGSAPSSPPSFGGGAVINHTGVLNIANCTFSANQSVGTGASGGAIFNLGRLTIADSTFSGNRSMGQGSAGGAIRNASFALITNSTFFENQAIGPPAPLVGRGNGGAIYSTGEEGDLLFIMTSTFSGNGVVTSDGQPDTGGAIIETLFDGSTKLLGTILAGNVSSNCNPATATAADGGYDLSDDDSCRFSGTSHNNVTDIFLAHILRNNGGPTETIALTSSLSAAIDLIPRQICPNTDQRGFLRPALGQARCDSGAFEFRAMPPP